ncbi:MAG: hypothetical protein GY870_08185 [archaeon]|nr:hypothetical protein [archaeon]
MSNYEEMVGIDQENLDIEWVNHSKNFYKISKKLSKKEKEWKNKWEDVKTKRAELMQELKEENPKATGPQMESYYRTHAEYKEVKQEMLELEYEKNDLNFVVESMRHRKIALENLVKLYGMEYFSDPKTPKNVDREENKPKAKEKVLKNKRKRKEK